MRSRLPVAAFALVAALLLPAAASAELRAAAKPAPAAKKATVKIRIGHLDNGRAPIMSRVPVIGTLEPFEPGQVVRVHYFLDGDKLTTKKAKVRKGKGDFGVFRSRIRLREGGKYAAMARYRGKLGHDRTLRKDWRPSYRGVGRGECGRVAKGFTRALHKLGYIVNDSGCFGFRSARGVLAFRRVNGMSQTFSASKRVVKQAFLGLGGYRVRHPGAGEHLEASLGKQVLVFADGDRPTAIYPISSGTSATPTVRGHFEFYMTQPGYNSKEMYYSYYFYGGYAIHGYESVPNYPASHGCLRTFIADQPEIYNKIDHGDDIFVF